jgi:isoleucyl-tRNA synthetase
VTPGAKGLQEFAEIIAEELNVKKVELVELAVESTRDFGVEQQLTVNSRALGPRLGKQVQEIITAAKSGNWEQVKGKIVVNGVELFEGEFELNLIAKDESSKLVSNKSTSYPFSLNKDAAYKVPKGGKGILFFHCLGSNL